MCNLSKQITKTRINWVSKDGVKFDYAKYINHGKGCGILDNGFLDLPKEGYPYTIEYDINYLFKCCQLCTTCSDKHPLPII
jgi:hypothetical protein